ncbi:hypothetical protein [Nocardia transvalensis]|uniref:hypothetical protein n=1 Tax=Nocardia transvalensis TaxID=37333 RepID=UPI0018941223|nr:hypothetical protein [Nocardia transvalensis]MBF6331057.1 hypothetical protein [Nocardia transvalensis]
MTATSPPAVSVSDEMRWMGAITLTRVDLDSVPPRVLPSREGTSFWVNYEDPSDDISKATLYGLDAGFFTTSPSVAVWTEVNRPTRQQCTDLVTARGTESLRLTKDSKYCVRTAAGRIAFLSDLSLDETAGAYAATATVWNSTS